MSLCSLVVQFNGILLGFGLCFVKLQSEQSEFSMKLLQEVEYIIIFVTGSNKFFLLNIFKLSIFCSQMMQLIN
jgi:hypothetical protein